MNNKIKILLLVIVAVSAALVWFLRYDKENPAGKNIPETNIAVGTVLGIEGNRVRIMSDVFTAGEGFKKIERAAVITEATQIEKYNLKEKKYIPVAKQDIKVGDATQIYYADWADEEAVEATLIQLTSPDDQLKVEDLIKSLK